MSLVNDMLRDLDKRRRLPPQAMRVSGVMEKHQVPSRFTSPWIAGAIVLSLLAGVTGGYFAFRQSSSVASVSPDANATLAATAAPEPTASESPIPVTAYDNLMDIVQESNNPQGFVLRIKALQPVQYSIVSRDTYGITLRLDGVDNYGRNAPTVPGMSVLLGSGGANIEIDLDEATDFTVFEDIGTSDFDIVLQANYRHASGPATAALHETNLQSAPITQPPQPVAPAGMAGTAYRSGQGSPLGSERATPVRVTRELTLEQRDASASRTAIALMQDGQLLEAYRDLLTFIAENPEAHQSRATLATVLLAQQDLVQAESVVAEGLAKAPNFAAYKKIQARILMQQNRAPQALAMLKEVQPTVADDPEYHEILASLYQRNEQHPLAVATYQQLLRYDGKQGRWWTGLAVSLEAQGKTDDALNSFRAALQSENLDSSLRQYNLARIRALGVSQ